ncbi:hypothetical protein, partial [Bacteroides sp.]|uniref:hypothetical protein n=1 Tax=Bacteroides sp. TaxID=29523 RepID=UPI003A8C4209
VPAPPFLIFITDFIYRFLRQRSLLSTPKTCYRSLYNFPASGLAMPVLCKIRILPYKIPSC